MTTNRFAAIDGLRGLAILMVTIYHINGFLCGGHGYSNPIVASMGKGVQLFFALSGFCLFYPLAKNYRNKKPLGSWPLFYKRRIIRIVPGYIAAIIIWTLVGSLWLCPLYLHQLLTHLLFLHVFFPDSRSAISGVLWSLGTEANFYMLFPLFAIIFVRKPFLAFLVCFYGCCLFRHFGSHLFHLDGTFVHYSLMGELGEFAIGMLAASILVNYPHETIRRYSPYCIVISLLALFVMPYLGKSPIQWVTIQNSQYLIASGWFALIILCIVEKNIIHRIMCWPPIVGLGVISYSVYLYNAMAMNIPTWLAFRPGSIAWILASLAGVGLCGIIGYYLFEYPFFQLRSRLRSRSQDKHTIAVQQLDVPNQVSN